MKRFIVLLLVCCLGAAVTARPIRGTVKCAGTPVSGVTVTDGHSFTESGADGTFTLDAADDALFISIVTPSGYLAPMEQDIPQFFRPYAASTKRYDFELRPWPATGEVYELLAIGDPQPKTAAHFDRLRTEIIPELQRATALGKQRGTAQAALLLGDIVWDSPELFAGVREQFASLGIPVYGVIGNHDHDRNKYTDREATENYRNHFGPTYYAFDMGRTHYIVLDDIVYHGAKKYDEQIDSLQLAWAAEYARRLPAGSRVCVAMERQSGHGVGRQADGRLRRPRTAFHHGTHARQLELRHPRRSRGAQRGTDLRKPVVRPDQQGRHAQRLPALPRVRRRVLVGASGLRPYGNCGYGSPGKWKRFPEASWPKSGTGTPAGPSSGTRTAVTAAQCSASRSSTPTMRRISTL